MGSPVLVACPRSARRSRERGRPPPRSWFLVGGRDLGGQAVSLCSCVGVLGSGRLGAGLLRLCGRKEVPSEWHSWAKVFAAPMGPGGSAVGTGSARSSERRMLCAAGSAGLCGPGRGVGISYCRQWGFRVEGCDAVTPCLRAWSG